MGALLRECAREYSAVFKVLSSFPASPPDWDALVARADALIAAHPPEHAIHLPGVPVPSRDLLRARLASYGNSLYIPQITGTLHFPFRFIHGCHSHPCCGFTSAAMRQYRVFTDMLASNQHELRLVATDDREGPDQGTGRVRRAVAYAIGLSAWAISMFLANDFARHWMDEVVR